MNPPTMNNGPVAVVTGAARGIGRQIAVDLLARGHRVVIGDLDAAQTDATARELGEGAIAMRLDITDRELVAEVIARVEREVGPIQVWVNNAGIMPTGPFLEQPMSLARTTIDIDYTALVEVTRAILPLMVARGSGHIVNMASATGVKPLAGVAAYSGAKAGVIAFSQALRRELRGTGVRLSVIMPNLVTTALGAGITPPALTGAVNAETVSTAVMRALDRGTFSVVVPRRLGPLLRFSNALPLRLRDWIDDRVGSDQIGLGGDPAARTAYLKGVLDKQ